MSSHRIVTRADLRRAVFLAVAMACACQPHGSTLPLLGTAGPIYDRLYPLHVEICALSQIRPYGQPSGGSAGHAVLYLAGACTIEDAPTPRLQACEGPRGVGISVNQIFKNVNWVAIPGRSFLLRGDLAPGEILTERRREAAVQRALRLGVFRGVEVHPAKLDLPVQTDVVSEERIARESLGTDYALGFGRSSFCAKLPITRSMLDAVIEFLNALNEQYASGEVEYRWSGYHDNCTHTIRNALAHARIWSPKAINTLKLRQLLHLAVPANEFVNLARLGNDPPLDRPRQLYRNRMTRATLLEQGWLPTRHGALIQTIPVHEPNELYDPSFKLFVLENPLLRLTTRDAKRMLRDHRYTEIEQNLLHFRQEYARILSERPEPAREAAPPGGFDAFRERYFSYLESQLMDVKDKLALLERTP